MTTVMDVEGAAAPVGAAGDGPMLAGPRLVALVRAVLRSGEAGMLPQLSRYTVVSVFALGLDFLLFLGLTHAGIAKAAIAGVIGYSAGDSCCTSFSRHATCSTSPTPESHRAGCSPSSWPAVVSAC